VEARAAICIQCGQRIGKEDQVETKMGRPEKWLAPIPAVAPGPARFREAAEDPLGRSEARKPVTVLAAALAALVVWKTADAETAGAGLTEAGAYLVRYGITVACAVGVTAILAAMLIEMGVGAARVLLAVGAALAAADLVQHALHYLPALGILPWIAAFGVCLMMLTDFLDIDLTDSVFLTLAIYVLKWILKATLFEAMFHTMGVE
jgi:hypothetical protein